MNGWDTYSIVYTQKGFALSASLESSVARFEGPKIRRRRERREGGLERTGLAVREINRSRLN